MKVKPEEIWKEHEKAKQYLESKNVYADVKQNELFYEGRHWEGLAETSLPKPVVNVLQRSVKYMVASLASNDIAINMLPFSGNKEDRERMKVIAEQLDNTIELARIKEASRELVRSGAVDGCCYMHQIFNPDIETGQPVKGDIENELVDVTNMEFGNPYSNDIQKQPYIIVVLRQDINQVKEEAERLKVAKDLINQIAPDNDTNYINDDSENLVTVLIKYYKDRNEDGSTTVWFTKCTSNVTLIEPTNLGYKRYPVSCFGWDSRKNSYLYTSPMTSVIPNQIFINKTVAMEQMMVLNNSFPRYVYDKSKVDLDDYLSTTAVAAVGMDMAGKFMDFIRPVDFSNQAPQLVNDTIAQTKDTLGVTDAQLGNVKPENTSAIIALQESSAVPLEIQKQNFYVAWEDTVRNLIDIMACNYGVRDVMTEEFGLVQGVDFSVLKNVNYIVKVEIGAGAQYSQIAQINTLDKYLQTGLIPGSLHAKLIPSKFLLGKEELVNTMQGLEQARAQMVKPDIGQRTLNSNEPL